MQQSIRGRSISAGWFLRLSQNLKDDKAVIDDLYSLHYVPDWFVTGEGVYMWYDDYYDDGDHWDDDDEDTFLSGMKIIKNERLKNSQ